MPHVAVFDTAFFATLPPAASTYAIPADLARTAPDPPLRHPRHLAPVRLPGGRRTGRARPLDELNQVVLHLGNGCSASAVHAAGAVETSMGLTPLQGLVMGTRSGDVDPGLHTYLHRELGLSVEEIDALLNKQSGLKGLGGVNDFRELEQRRGRRVTHAAQLAFDVYVHRLKHYLGAYLGHARPAGRAHLHRRRGREQPRPAGRRGRGPGGLGLAVDPARTTPHPGRPGSSPRTARPITVAVVPTNEELEIARQTAALLGTRTA